MKETKLRSGKIIGDLKLDLKNKIVYGEIKNIADAKNFLKKHQKNT
jgi:hypothetical protein